MIGTPTDLEARVDDEHRAVLDVLPSNLLDLSSIESAREQLNDLVAMTKPPMPDGVTTEDVQVPGMTHESGEQDPDVMVRLYRPDGLGSDAPVLYWIHGGGMVLGSVAWNDVECATRALELQCVVASVEYRLAPEHPFPAPMNDCYVGLEWLAANAATVGVDPERLVLGGASAGGGLAAGLTLMARDRGGPTISFQLLVYPMIDHRNITPSSHAIHDARVWNRAANLTGWAAYLGRSEDRVTLVSEEYPVSIYASPSLAEDLGGLPPAYINVGDLDMFLDEDVAYAQGLNRAGVAVEFRVYPGAFHGSNGQVSRSMLSQRWLADENDALRRAMHKNY